MLELNLSMGASLIIVTHDPELAKRPPAYCNWKTVYWQDNKISNTARVNSAIRYPRSVSPVKE